MSTKLRCGNPLDSASQFLTKLQCGNPLDSASQFLTIQRGCSDYVQLLNTDNQISKSIHQHQHHYKTADDYEKPPSRRKTPKWTDKKVGHRNMKPIDHIKRSERARKIRDRSDPDDNYRIDYDNDKYFRQFELHSGGKVGQWGQHLLWEPAPIKPARSAKFAKRVQKKRQNVKKVVAQLSKCIMCDNKYIPNDGLIPLGICSRFCLNTQKLKSTFSNFDVQIMMRGDGLAQIHNWMRRGIPVTVLHSIIMEYIGNCICDDTNPTKLSRVNARGCFRFICIICRDGRNCQNDMFDDLLCKLPNCINSVNIWSVHQNNYLCDHHSPMHTS
jgi:hypothetical protein